MRALAHRWAAWGRRPLSAALALLAALAGWSGAGEQAPKERVVDLGGGVKMTLVLIPAGTFTMGSTDAEIKAVLAKWPEAKEEWFASAKPAHKVTISKAFWMGKHEVTVGQFRLYADTTGKGSEVGPSTFIPGAVVATRGELQVVADASWRAPYFRQTDAHPVVCMSWGDAKRFAAWLNDSDKSKPAGWRYRLPTEAEWEYACRAGTTTWYQWGDNPDKGTGWCNALDLAAKKSLPKETVFSWADGFVYTAPVGSFKPNAFGLHDMHGNAAEWCEDWWGPYEEGEQTDPTGPPLPLPEGDRRLLRGGSWLHSPWSLRSAQRLPFPSMPGSSANGFRLVLAARPQ